MKHRKKRDHEGISFWESTADLLAALLLILLLIIMLLFLYLRMYPENTEVDPEWGDHYTHETEEYHQERETEWHQTTSSSGGDDEDDTEEEWDDDEDRDDRLRAAVHLSVVDGETGNRIPQEGLRFRLYRTNNKLRVLYDYYPEKVAIKEYETTQKGDFFLPEKIYAGGYYFKNYSTLPGYLLAPNADFYVDHSYEWSEPLEVVAELFPIKNTIAIRLVDVFSGEALTDAVFSVVAAEDIKAADGSIRYAAGTTVSEMTVDESGYAISDELYLGSYRLEQTKSPKYYAAVAEPVEIPIEELSESARLDLLQMDEQEQAAQAREIGLEKTQITLTLTDETSGLPIPDAVFEVTNEANADYLKTLTTDAEGQAVLSNIRKNTTYHFKQQSVTGSYRITQPDLTVKVDKRGRIDGSAKYELAATNRMIRVSIGVKDKVIRNDVSDQNLSLFNEKDELIRTWSTTNGEEVFDDLAVGDYYLTVNGGEEKHEFTVEDTANTQHAEVETYTSVSYALIAGIVVAAALVLLLLIILIRRAMRKKK